MPLKFGKSIGNFLVKNLIVTLLLSQTVRALEDELRSLSFGREPSSYMDGKVLMSSFVYDAFACQILCLRELKCLSLNFDNQADKEGNHLCELLDQFKQKNRLLSSKRFDFYDYNLNYPRSCSHAKSLGYRESMNYTIDPDAREETLHPFQVFCDMHDKDGVGVTVVSHDSEDRTLVHGCEEPGCYRRDVLYDWISDVNAQLGALTKVSTHCEQYIKYECYGSITVGGFAWLVSRDGRRLNYWGGAPPNSGKCACGVAGNCAGGLMCNCDINRRPWQEDSGFLNYKDDLPITMLRFGDVNENQNEKGYHTLGKLRCY